MADTHKRGDKFVDDDLRRDTKGAHQRNHSRENTPDVDFDMIADRDEAESSINDDDYIVER